MNFRDTARRAGQHGVDAMRNGFESARNHFTEAETAIRQKMRLHPSGTGRANVHNDVGETSLTEEDVKADLLDQAEQKRTPIISINGRDVDLEEFNHRRSA